jgi:hypothetical protein
MADRQLDATGATAAALAGGVGRGGSDRDAKADAPAIWLARGRS